MVVQQALDDVGVELVGDAMPKDKRTVKEFQKLISAMRRAEAAVLDQLSSANAKALEAQDREAKMMARISELEAELRRYKAEQVIESDDQLQMLSTASKQKLLAAAS